MLVTDKCAIMSDWPVVTVSEINRLSEQMANCLVYRNAARITVKVLLQSFLRSQHG